MDQIQLFYSIRNTCIESLHITSLGTRIKCYESLENIGLRLGSWCIYVHCIFNYVTDYLHETILLSCVLLSSCHFICFILFSNRLIDEHSRDHYRELTKEQNLGFDEEHLKIIDTLNAKQRAAFEEILIMSWRAKDMYSLLMDQEAPLRHIYIHFSKRQ